MRFQNLWDFYTKIRVEVWIYMKGSTLERRLFVCIICDKALSTSYNLKTGKMIHTAVQPSACSKCEKAFKESRKLKAHKMIHTGERLFKCLKWNGAFMRVAIWKHMNFHGYGYFHEVLDTRLIRCANKNKFFLQFFQ